MVTVQFYMSDDNLAAFFENAGFDTQVKTVSAHTPAYHNREIPMLIDKLHVRVNNDEFKPADEVYQAIMKRRMITPDPTTIAIANEILNND